MITLLASITGFISSLIPDALKFLLDKSDKKHELEILKLQIQMQEKGINNNLEEIQAVVDLNEAKAIYATYKSGINWIDSLNGTVRPVLAYAFFFIYSFTKFLQYQVLITQITILDISLLWSEEDQAIFAGIISFYYGQRALSKVRK